MRLLAIDSSGPACSAALWDGATAACIAHSRHELSRGQAETLVPLIRDLMASAGCGFGDLDLIAVCHGPGSFTGIRVAVAVARGFALATGLPLVPVNALEALAEAAPAPESGRILALLDARRGEVYAQSFNSARAALDAPAALSPAALAHDLHAPACLVGSGAPLVTAACGETPPGIAVHVDVAVDAVGIAARAARLVAAGLAPIHGFDLRPLYVRAPNARPQAPLALRAV